eukprot:PhF_6_TR955/c2_g1_i1/m.1786/K17943/PUM; pumilio RNA-binding family
MAVNKDAAWEVLNRPRPKSSPGLRPTHSPADILAENVDDTDFRAQPEYHDWYYAQHPRDPRVPPPIVTWKHYQMGFTKTSPQVRPYSNPFAAGGGAGIGLSGLHNDISPLDRPIETPEMIPRNLLTSTTPAQSPQIQPLFELPPAAFMLPPSSTNLTGHIPPPSYAQHQQAHHPSPHTIAPQPPSQPPPQVQQQQQQPLPPNPQPMTLAKIVMQGGSNHSDNSAPPQTAKIPQPSPAKPNTVTATKPQPPAQQQQQPQQSSQTSTPPQPSSLLADFRARANAKWELLDLRGHIVEFSKDQEGSRFIQRQTDVATNEARAMVADEVVPVARDLTMDVFGNYVVQKTLEYGTEAVCKKIINALLGDILTLTLHTYGCRVVQRALEVADRPLRLLIANELRDDVIRCIHDQNGNHVLQKCIEVVPDSVGFIVSALRGNAKEIACHAYGCRVMQRLLEQCAVCLRNDPLLDEILSHIKELVRNQYGNYVVQHVLINADQKYKNAVIDCIIPDFFELASHKFASNVVEKVVVHNTEAGRSHLVDLWQRSKAEDGTLWLTRLVTNQYGNYVVQRMFEHGTEAQKVKLIAALQPHLGSIRQHPCARHIVNHVEGGGSFGGNGGAPSHHTGMMNNSNRGGGGGGGGRGRGGDGGGMMYHQQSSRGGGDGGYGGAARRGRGK